MALLACTPIALIIMENYRMGCEGPHCNGCPRQFDGVKYVAPDGLGTSGILVLGEAPWLDEIRSSKPLAGPASFHFDKLLRRAGIERNSLILTNTVNCKVPYLGWFDKAKNEAAAAISHCDDYFQQALQHFNPKVILALGGVALQKAAGVSDVTSFHGYVLDGLHGVPVVGTFHPSYIMKGNAKLSPAFCFALRRAQAGDFRRQPTTYLTDSLIPDILAYLSEWDGRTLAFDIETPRSGKLDEDSLDEDPTYEIIRVSFSYKPTTAVSVPWVEPYISLCKSILARAQEVIFWNGSFDVPRLRTAGVKFNGRIIDAMWAFHFLQSDLPKSLGFVTPFYSDLAPWKHLSDSEPAYYSAVDADATIRNYLGIRADLEAQGRWLAFERHCVEVSPLLDTMGRKGLLVDKVRQDDFKARLEVELMDAKARLQEMAPLEVKPRKPYKKPPADLKDQPPARFEKCCQKDDCRKCKGKGEIPIWERILDFNPDSPLQVTNLIKHFRLEVPKNRKTGGESTGAKYLARFAKKHDVFKWILECRKRADMLGTFIWTPNSDGRVATQYGFHPSTWRKSSRAVNLQNIPKRDDLAKEFRRMLVASPGHVLIEADSAAIEAVLVGYAAGDQAYIRAAKAGIHSFITSHLEKCPVSLSLPFDQLVVELKKIKKAYKATYETAKRGGHATNYKLSPYGLHDEYPEFFPTLKAGQQFQDFYFGLFPSIPNWHKSTLERAHKESYLDNDFGYRHYFYDVFNYDRDSGGWKLGNDAKRAIAFKPQSNASAIQTEYLLQLADDEQVRPCMRLVIHDSIVLEVPKDQAQEVAWKVYSVMTSPIAQLQGLSIGAEVQIGESLGEMEVLEFDKIKA